MCVESKLSLRDRAIAYNGLRAGMQDMLPEAKPTVVPLSLPSPEEIRRRMATAQEWFTRSMEGDRPSDAEIEREHRRRDHEELKRRRADLVERISEIDQQIAEL